MRLEGLLSDEQLLDVIKNIGDGDEWIYEDLGDKIEELLKGAELKERLKHIYESIKSWKEKFGILSKHTVFVFVDSVKNPSALKIYDTKSLGCGTSLAPPRWKIYKRELKGRL